MLRHLDLTGDIRAPGGAAPLRHWGARALARRAADPRKVRQGADRNAPGASRRSISLACKGEGKRERATPGRPKSKHPGGVALSGWAV
jgi:hypothetical protein